MNLIPELVAEHTEIMSWRRDLHAHPELAFNEMRTANFVATELAKCGIEVKRGIGKTGVVGYLRSGGGDKSVGLRADMDALAVNELNKFAHKSRYPGVMHGCGHDGHTAMLLAAARHLARTRSFNGTVYFIFQPAEEANEAGSGSKAMIDDGLFTRFSIDQVFGMHNLPGLSTGKMAICPGPVMAAMDLFDVKVSGHGTHAAMPHTGIDPILASAHLLTAWQSIVSRNIDPRQAAVISATSIHGGDTWNVIPESITIRGSVRAFLPEVQEKIESRFRAIAEHVAASHGVDVNISYRNELPSVINSNEMAAVAKAVAVELLGEDNVMSGTDAPQLMGSEDFSFMLKEKPGAYVWIGNGDGEDACSMLHKSEYDFNDDMLAVGASFWVKLVEYVLS